MRNKRALVLFTALLLLAIASAPALAVTSITGDSAGSGPDTCNVDTSEACVGSDLFLPNTTEASAQNGGCTCAVLFYSPTCEHCHKVDNFLTRMKEEKYPNLLVKKYDASQKLNAELKEAVDVEYGVPQMHRGYVPAFYMGEYYVIGEDLERIEGILEEYDNCGLKCPTDRILNTTDVSDIAQQSIIERFETFGPLAIVFAGLVDSINPCAIAGIIFFISYLTILGKKGKEILVIGALYSLGIFTAYLGLGWGIFQFMQHIQAASEISKAIYPLTGLLTGALAFYTIKDYFKAKEGKTEDMTLQLPPQLKSIIHKVIRVMVNMKAIIIVAFFTGFVVSIFEFLCTGQVYLPTIIYIMGVEGLRDQATYYMILYNLLFITPLVVIFIAAYFGTTSRELQALLVKHAAKVKLLTAIFFVLLTAYMLVLSANLYGLFTVIF